MWALLHSLVLAFKISWDIYGILLYLGLLWALVRTFRTRGPLFWTVAGGIMFCLLWRSWALSAPPSRYYSIFLLPAVFFGVYLIFRGPWPRKISWLLLVGVVLGSLAKDFRSNPFDRKILELYREIAKDSRNFSAPLAISFTNKFAREKYYTNIPLCHNDRRTDWENTWKGLHGNLSVYRGDYDVVYGFIEAPAEIMDPVKELEDLMPGRIKVVNTCRINLHRKKMLWVFRYLPEAEDVHLPDFPAKGLLPNGDFSKLRSPDGTRALLARLCRMSARFKDKDIILPESWNFYQSRHRQTNSFATVLKKNGNHVLRLESGVSYFIAQSPGFNISKERRLTFRIVADKESDLQLTRAVEGKGRGLYPMLTLRLSPGKERMYSILFPACPGSDSGKLWFWLQTGEIELSDVRIE